MYQDDGTDFENIDWVLTVSVQGKKNYPFWKEKSDVDIVPDDRTGDEENLRVLEYVLHEWRGCGDILGL